MPLFWVSQPDEMCLRYILKLFVCLFGTFNLVTLSPLLEICLASKL